MTGGEQSRIEVARLVPCDLRCLLHREENTLEEYPRISMEYCARIAGAAHGLGGIVPPARLAAPDEA